MPSRKRNKGRARAATKNNRQQEGKEEEEQCFHGYVRPPPWHVVHRFLYMIEKSICRSEMIHDVPFFFQSLHREHPEAIEDPNNRKIIKSYLIGIGTAGLTSSPQLVLIAIAWLATGVMFIEEYEKKRIQGKEMSLRNILGKQRDLLDGGEDALIRFHATRNPCSCLREKNEGIRTQQKKGRCSHCVEWKEYTQLMICGRCRVSQYCSIECQRAHWPEHKEYCAHVAGSK